MDKKIMSINPKGGDSSITASEFVQRYNMNVDFEAYAKSLRQSELKDFHKFFDCIRKGLKMIDRIGDGVDKGGRPYLFYNFIKARALTGCKIFPIGDWETFIDDYQDGNIRIAFSVEELAEAAMNE